MQDHEAESLPPLVIYKQAARPDTPPPLVIRERPPTPPQVSTEPLIIERRVTVPEKQRKIIIEHLPAPPAKPRDIILEKWLPARDPAQPRQVFIQKALPAANLPAGAVNNSLAYYPSSAPQQKQQQFERNGSYGGVAADGYVANDIYQSSQKLCQHQYVYKNQQHTYHSTASQQKPSFNQTQVCFIYVLCFNLKLKKKIFYFKNKVNVSSSNRKTISDGVSRTCNNSKNEDDDDDDDEESEMRTSGYYRQTQINPHQQQPPSIYSSTASKGVGGKLTGYRIIRQIIPGPNMNANDVQNVLARSKPLSTTIYSSHGEDNGGVCNYGTNSTTNYESHANYSTSTANNPIYYPSSYSSSMFSNSFVNANNGNSNCNLFTATPIMVNMNNRRQQMPIFPNKVDIYLPHKKLMNTNRMISNNNINTSSNINSYYNYLNKRENKYYRCASNDHF